MKEKVKREGTLSRESILSSSNVVNFPPVTVLTELQI